MNPAKISWGNPSREILSGFGPKGQNWDSQSGIAFMADWIPIWRDLDFLRNLFISVLSPHDLMALHINHSPLYFLSSVVRKFSERFPLTAF